MQVWLEWRCCVIGGSTRRGGGRERDLQDPTGEESQFELFDEPVVPGYISLAFGVLGLSFGFRRVHAEPALCGEP